MEDKGILFDVGYMDKIFRPFQKLRDIGAVSGVLAWASQHGEE